MQLSLPCLWLAAAALVSTSNAQLETGIQQPVQDDANTCSCEEPLKSESIIIQRSQCDPNNATYCELHCGSLHDSTYLTDKCCIHAGKSASLLAFEEAPEWIPRLEEFNKCTGASVRLEYLPEGEDGMAQAIRTDVGDDISHGKAGENIFDAYIVQAPWCV